MSDGKIEKMEKDFSPQVDQLLPETESLQQQGKLQEALEKLLTLEKQARMAADQASTGRILIQVVKLCYESREWKLLNENVILLSKKHGQLKAATTKMVQEAMSHLDDTPDMETKLELIDTLRTVTEGKIFVEVERARLTRILSKIREDEGKIEEAADILQELQVETFGSMDKREKTDFILEQMRLLLAKRDYTRTQIISKKINTRFFKDEENEDLKLRFYDLMIKHAMHEEQYLNVCKFYRAVYDTKSIQGDESKWTEVLQNIILFIVLSPYDNEQSDLLHRIYSDPNLTKISLYNELAKCFVTNELMRWPKIEEIYGSTLQQTSVFSTADEAGRKRWSELHNRVIEHNIRVIAKYYTRISTKRLTQLLDLNEQESEEFLSKLVVSKTIHAKIDRPAGVISFQVNKSANQILNDWSNDINSLLGLIEKTCHLISKEIMSAEQPSEAQVQEITQKTENIVLDENGQPLSKKALKKLEKEREKAARKAETAARVAQEQAANDAPDYSTGKYGKLPMNQSQERTGRAREDITKINASRAGETVLIRARVQTSRAKSSKLCFFVFRQGVSTIQGILATDADKISKQMSKYGASIPVESIVLVEAEIAKAEEEIKSCTISDAELKIKQLHVIAEAEQRLPFSLEDASRPESDMEKEDAQFSRVALDTRLNNRVLDLRTTTGNAIFKIQSGVCHLFRDFLYKRDFMEIHTPKIIATPSEGGANVFSIKYFNTEAYLAQSPQLYKQMAISGDFNRVFEIGPVFRAENSNTHRHMTEFVGLDMEMAFEEHYHEVLDVLDEMFVSIFTGLKEKFNNELEAVKRQMPFEDFQFLPKTLRLKFADGIAMLREAGVELGDYDDLSTEQERFLGKLVKEKYHTDFYMLDKFPLAIRPFYTMPDPENPNYSNSYDFFMRGEEILSGAQRIHDAKFLEERCKIHGVDMKHIQPYIDAFKIAAPPHAGGGIGLERVVMLYMGLGNIRRSSLFPRDPKRLEP
ncbi:hypothetical protein NQZ79_g7790 [Umbelopsis isabellina]|nr:hypothetical protein NQZ79_g7790 [Umbelopsis isabellina]